MRGLIFTCCVAVAVPAAAAPPRPSALVGALTACKDVVADPARLACYDAAAGRLAEATAKGDLRVVDREDIRETRRSLFGFTLPKLPFFGGDDSAGDTPEQIDTVVRDVHDEGYSKFTLVMEDGAVWRTTEPLPRDPKPGAKVHIKSAALGSYFMTVNGGRSIRAMRVR